MFVFAQPRLKHVVYLLPNLTISCPLHGVILKAYLMAHVLQALFMTPDFRKALYDWEYNEVPQL